MEVLSSARIKPSGQSWEVKYNEDILKLLLGEIIQNGTLSFIIHGVSANILFKIDTI